MQLLPIKEGLIINNPQRRLPKDQRKLFENNGWEIIDAAQPAHNNPHHYVIHRMAVYECFSIRS